MPNVFETFASLKLDASEYNKGLDNAGAKGKSFASSLSSGFGKVMGGMLKVSAVALGTAATGVGLLTKQSVQAYGDFEQLTGGIETLYGDASDEMMKFAEQAFMTTGQSQNQFMEAAIATSAAMINSLEGDQQKAAELTNLSMMDMADNVNKMGTSMEAVQNAYRGFSRGNFTMLDNLALGYAGTKEGMEQLLADAQAISDVEYDISSYSDMVEAIHVIQTEMGITGTTANEAKDTIQGSLGAMSAAWQNLITGLADPNADLGTLIDNMVTTAETALGNIVPVATRAIGGIATVVSKVAPIIAKELPGLIDQLLPPILEAASTLFSALVQNLPSILEILIEELPGLLNTVIEAAIQIAPQLITLAVELIKVLGQGLIDNLPIIIPAITELITMIATDLLSEENLAALINGALQIIMALSNGLVEALPQLASVIPVIIGNLIMALVDNLPALGETIVTLVENFGPTLIGIIGGLMGMSMEEAQRRFMLGVEAVKGGLQELGNRFKEGLNAVKQTVSTIFTNIYTTVSTKISSVYTTISSKLTSIKTKFSSIFETVKTTVSNAIDKIKSIFDFDWSLPELKLPHISVTGGVAPYGIGGAGSLPSFSIQWYKKAYDDAYLLNDATIFGQSGNKLLAGGEGSGSEAIVGTELLMNMVDEVVKKNMANLNFSVVLDTGELVGGIVGKVDNQLGKMSEYDSRKVVYR